MAAPGPDSCGVEYNSDHGALQAALIEELASRRLLRLFKNIIQTAVVIVVL